MESEKAEKWLDKLDSPIPGYTREESRDDFDDLGSFQSMMG